MADVRALLRAERAARGSTAPKPQKPPAAIPPPNSKKRKAADPKIAEIVKRLRAEEEDHDKPETSDDTGPLETSTKADSSERLTVQKTKHSADVELSSDTRRPKDGDASSSSRPDLINEDEWAAFERDIADLESEPIQQTAAPIVNSTAVISAPAMTAEEVAARTERDKNQYRRREEELELEKEDAATALQEEFDEIDRLEERARKVREMREKLRERQLKDGAERGEGVTDEAKGEQPDEEEDDDDLDDW